MHRAQSNLSSRFAFAALTIVALGQPAGAASSSKIVKAGNVTAQAHADRQTVVPGDTLHVAVALRMEKDWHVYWRSPGPGGTGLPTKIEWSAPDGFEVGPTEFPVPRAKYDKILEETSYILEDAAVFVTPIRVPATAKVGAEARLAAKVSWLACKLNCIPGGAELSLSVPVVSPGTAAKPANKQLFEGARAAFPTPAEKAEHVKLRGAIDKQAASPGEKFTATLTVEIAKGHHMQSHKPLQEGLIPAYLFVESPEGFYVGEVAYPKGQVREDKILGKLSEYSGKIEIEIPVEVDEEADKQPRRLGGLLQYQLCTDSGTCYPPQHVTWAIPVQMEAGPAAVRAENALAPTDEGSAPTIAAADEENEPDGTQADKSPGSVAAVSSSAGEGWFNRLQNGFLARGYYGVLLLALIGGFVLNLMPCVLPVISLKILSFVRQAHEDRGRIFLLGLAYCAGIMVFFGLLALLFYRTGAGWGEHFQNPVVILVLGGIVTAFALSLFGVFAVFTPQVVNELGVRAEQREGVSSAFLTGVLATILGTACTAPFLSAAVGAASRFTPQQGAMIFLAVGAGMAFPFLVLAAKPGWLRYVPKPGPWMGTFEAVMGFLLLGTVFWLLNPIRGLLGDWGLLLTLIFLLGVAIAVWVKGRVQFSDPPGRKLAFNGAALVLLVLAWLVPFRWVSTLDRLQQQKAEHQRLYAIGRRVELTGGGDSSAITWDPSVWQRNEGEIPWVPYDPQQVRDYVNAGYAVFVDFTADWCITCKSNLKSSIDIASTRALMQQLNIVPFGADYTRKDPGLKRIFESYGRASVPLYLVFSPFKPDEPEILPEVLTPGSVETALQKAGASRPKALAKVSPGASADRATEQLAER